MLDFMDVAVERDKKGVYVISPDYIVRSSPELLIRGGDFYAIWNEGTKLWSTSEDTAFELMDKKLDEFAKKYREENPENPVKVLHLKKAKSGMVDVWHKFVKQQLRDSNPCPQLDEKIIFSNMETSMTDYASKKLPYALEEHETPAYDEIISTLYSPEERAKLEWAIGAVVSGDSKKVQKFVVMYGPPASGKSTMLNIIQQLFDGYYCVFDSKALGSANNSFALEAFKSNPLVAIQHDGDLSRIEDNTRLNSLVSHEMMTVNEKFKSAYATRFNSFLFMGTNKPVKITDSKSGLIRRLIDISPSGHKIKAQRYAELTEAVKYELGGIAYHCLSVYKANKRAYDNYIPTQMISYTNDFYNYITDPKVFATFSQTGSTTL